MSRRFKKILTAGKLALQTKRDWFWLATWLVAFFLLFVMIPVWTTPGDSFFFHLSILKPEVWVLMISLSFLNAFVVILQRHIRRMRNVNVSAGQVGSGISALASGLMATVGCGACYSSLLALFGLSGSVFIVEHRWWFAAIAGGLAIWALDSSAEKIIGGCKKCRIDIPS